jgi:hypothetical protein
MAGDMLPSLRNAGRSDLQISLQCSQRGGKGIPLRGIDALGTSPLIAAIYQCRAWRGPESNEQGHGIGIMGDSNPPTRLAELHDLPQS